MEDLLDKIALIGIIKMLINKYLREIMLKIEGSANRTSGLEPWPLARAEQGFIGTAFSFWCKK